jgi:hypothetical protein
MFPVPPCGFYGPSRRLSGKMPSQHHKPYLPCPLSARRYCRDKAHTALLALLLLPFDFHCEPSNASFAAVVEFCWTWIHPAPHSHQSPGT